VTLLGGLASLSSRLAWSLPLPFPRQYCNSQLTGRRTRPLSWDGTGTVKRTVPTIEQSPHGWMQRGVHPVLAGCWYHPISVHTTLFGHFSPNAFSFNPSRVLARTLVITSRSRSGVSTRTARDLWTGAGSPCCTKSAIVRVMTYCCSYAL
jgi:hypothetical protein